MRVIDWSKPAYRHSYVRRTLRRGQARRIDCDLCHEPIEAGQRWHQGPRGRRAVHASCREKHIANTQEQP